MRVRVPASVANLGSGFDAAALAIEIFDDVVAQVVDEPGFSIDVHGEGQDFVPRDAKHLVARAMTRTFDVLDVSPLGVALVCANRIPHSRGLGSSAAATCAGVLLARELVPGAQTNLTLEDMIALGAEIEGHADNVAACFRGGLTVAWQQLNGDDRAAEIDSKSWAVSTQIAPMILVSTTTSSTKKARSALPTQVPLTAAAANLARSALLVEAFTRDPALLMTATDDFIHQAHRAELMADSFALMTRLREANVPAAIAGAGSSVIAFPEALDRPRVVEMAGGSFEALDVAVDASGARVEPL